MSQPESAFPRDEHLTAIAIAYKNPDTTLIADEVFPRTAVGKMEFSWTEYPDHQGYTVPDTRVGEKSKVPQLELRGQKRTSHCEDFGLDVPLSANDISQAAPNTDPREYATEQATNLVLLDREVRAAALAFDPTRYPSSNKKNLATSGDGGGPEQWDDPETDPLEELVEGLDSCLIRPNVLSLGQRCWTKLSMHPKIVSAGLGNSGQHGRITRARLAELLEIAEVVVGAAFVNIVKPNKTPVLARVWGPHALAFYRDRTVTTAGGLTFGYTAQFGTRVAGSKVVDMGLHGGTMVRAGESVRELIVAPRAAFFWQNAVSAG
jgi:hypothetical protein